MALALRQTMAPLASFRAATLALGIIAALALALGLLVACTEHTASESERAIADEPAQGGASEAGVASRSVESGSANQRDAGASNDTSPGPGSDGDHDASLDAQGHAAVALARARWAELEREHGDTYWYEEENCLVNFKNGWSTFVQVEEGKARVLGTRTFPRAQCERVVNRYPMELGARTLPELFMLCEKEVLAAPNRELASESGLLESCFYATAPRCKDNCGAGYHLRRWDFGHAPAFQDEPIDGQQACLSHELSWERNGGLVAYTDVSRAQPCNNYQAQRVYFAVSPPRDDGANVDAGVGCSNLIATGAEVGVGALNAALAHADVARALARDAGVYGHDLRPVDGQILRVTARRNGANSSATLELGSDCMSTDCTAIPPGLSALRQLLLKLAAQQHALPGCVGLR